MKNRLRFGMSLFVLVASSSFVHDPHSFLVWRLIAAEQKTSQSPTPAPIFEDDVLPILRANNCLGCHGPSLKLKNLDLSNYQSLMKGSETGPVVVSGKPESSRLYNLIQEGKMPPKGSSRVTADEVSRVRSWIAAGANSSDGSAQTAMTTQHQVIPIMLLHCTVCHGLRKQEAGLDLRTKAGMLKGGISGPAIVPGKPKASLLVQRIRDGQMPPKRRLSDVQVKPVSEAEAQVIDRWIAQGSPEIPDPPDVAGTPADPLVTDKDRQFWAFQPPRRFDPTRLRRNEWVRNPIDAFVLAKLDEKGMQPSPEADRLVLIRRVSFDLTGLPPDPAEVKAFLADKRASAYEELVDRLLASPRYGERWGRYWLDAAGYADSEGGKMTSDDPRPLAWRYRDYVIRSLNADKFYDRFLLEQIAGDELADYENSRVVTTEMMDNLIATGFLRMAPDSTNEGPVNYVEERVDVIADEMEILGSTVLGLTLKCARCHSHKYDPIPQRDYYRMAAVFKGAYDEHDWIPPLHLKETSGRLLPYVAPELTPFQAMDAERLREEHNKQLDDKIKAAKEELQKSAEPIRKKILDERIAQFPKPLQDDLRSIASIAPENRNEVQKYLAEKFQSLLNIKPSALKIADPDYEKKAREVERNIAVLESKIIPESKIRALWDRGTPSPTYIHRRGVPTDTGELVHPGVPAALTVGIRPYEITPPWPGARSTGRRLALARWLIQPDHPLTARVMVNRMWAHHFGQGIVKSVGNFGHTGSPPTHPELLDWLAGEFVRQGWSMKAVHRLMVTSSTYRQSSALTPELQKADSDNRLLSRMPLTRLDAESLGDTLFLLSGRLNERAFGPPDPVFVDEDGLAEPIEGENGFRRSIYIRQRRSQIPTLWDSFDYPQLSPACLERNRSNVPTQALTMLNDPTVRKLAGHFAERAMKEAGPAWRPLIERAYWLALSRPPSKEELAAGLEMFRTIVDTQKEGQEGPLEQKQRAAFNKFCHTLLNSAAFIYVD